MPIFPQDVDELRDEDLTHSLLMRPIPGKGKTMGIWVNKTINLHYNTGQNKFPKTITESERDRNDKDSCLRLPKSGFSTQKKLQLNLVRFKEKCF